LYTESTVRFATAIAAQIHLASKAMAKVKFSLDC